MSEGGFEKRHEDADRVAWQAAAYNSATALSRTADGTRDTSSSFQGRPAILLEGKELSEQVQENITHAVELLWQHKNSEFAGATSVHAFVENLSRVINTGIADPDAFLYRTWETKYPSTSPENIQAILSKKEAPFAVIATWG